MTAGLLITAVGLAGTLYADFRESAALRWVFKPLASLGFLVIAFWRFTGDGSFSPLHAGLVLSAFGDVALISRQKRAFATGLAAFALAHVAYMGHFVSDVLRTPGPFTVPVAAGAFALFMGVGHLVWKWLEPKTGSMRVPVRVYVLLVSLMAASAVVSATAGTGVTLIAVPGAVMFYLSDLAVARDRFIAHSFANKAWGLPLYYAGQVLIALAARG